MDVTIPDFIQQPTGVVGVTVSAPTLTVQGTTVGGGLQQSRNFFLESGNHGGVDVTITSSNPQVAELALNGSTAGSGSITVSVPDGQTSGTYWVQGVQGATGTVTLTGTATGFTDGTATVDVVQPAVRLIGVNTSLTTLDGNDAFGVRIGYPSGTTVAAQQLSPAVGSVTATVTSSAPTVAQLVGPQASGASLTVDILAGEWDSPSGAANGGLELDPLTAGNTTVDVTIPDFIQQPTGVVSVTVE